MRKRRRYEEYDEPEEAVQLGDVLEPYEDGWNLPPDAQGDWDDVEEYSQEHEEADHESRFRIAIGMFDLVSIFVGILVILVLVAMLLMLFNWLRSDILHSALLMQSGLQ